MSLGALGGAALLMSLTARAAAPPRKTGGRRSIHFRRAGMINPSIRAIFTFFAAFASMISTPSAAVPPPVVATFNGPAPLCAARFGVRLTRGEHAEQYARDWWGVSGPGYQMGIRSDMGPLNGLTARVAVPNFPRGERQRVREYPGDGWWGWTYAFALPDGVTLRIASAEFQGSHADFEQVRRIVVGTQRDALCRSNR
jgi:hypothetical protein